MTMTNRGRRRITFTFEEVGHRQIILTGDFNQWDIDRHPMRKKSDSRIKSLPYTRSFFR